MPSLLIAATVLTMGFTTWQRIQPETSSTFLAGTGGVPGGREAGTWINANVPLYARLLTIGPSMANILQFYGERHAFGLSVSPNPLHRNPSYIPIVNPDLQIRRTDLNYIVWDSYSASRSPFFSDKLLNYVKKYNGTVVHTETIPLTDSSHPDPIWNVLSPIRTLTATLGIEMGEVSVGSEHYSALFGIAVVLLIITLIINLSAVAILRRLKEGRPAARPGHKPFISDSVKERLELIREDSPDCCPDRVPVHRCTLVYRCRRLCWYWVGGYSAGTVSQESTSNSYRLVLLLTAFIVLSILVIILRTSSSTACLHSRGNS